MNNYLSQFSGFSGIGNQGFGVVDPMRARAEQMRVGLANSGINGVPEASLTGAARTQSPPVILDEGKSYFLKQNTALRDRLMATERESARRGNRPVQGIAPTYNYETATGERFRGTFLGDGSYRGFGRQRKEGATKPTPPPAGGAANFAQGIAPTLGETPSPYSGSAIDGTAYTPSAGNMGMGAYNPPTMGSQVTSIAGGTAPAPLAAPLPSLNFPTRQDEILNPYGLRNF